MSAVDSDMLAGKGGLRDKPGGWTLAVVKRLVCWLQSVNEQVLFVGRFVFGITLTYGRGEGCPSSGQVSLDREALIAFLRRQGCSCWHWLVEFQRDGTPHLHLVVAHPSNQFIGAEVVCFWLARTARYRTREWGQCVKRMFDYVGWAKYLAKHASRQNGHYQRRELPSSWGGYSGRMWGYGGEWEVQDEVVIEMDGSVWHKVRRVLAREMRVSHRAAKPKRSDFHDEAMYLVAFRKWRKSLVYLRRMFKGLPKAARERAGYRHGGKGADEVIPLWSRSWSTYKPINFWMAEFLVRKVYENSNVRVGVVRHSVDDTFSDDRGVDGDICSSTYGLSEKCVSEVLQWISR